jgi:predicted LPLAT superfamily acyltransferase
VSKTTSQSDSHWSSRSLGSKFQHGIFYFLIGLGGRRAAYVLLHMVVFWYVLFYPSVRRRAGFYMRHRFPNDTGFKRFMHVFRMCLAMGKALVDRAIMGILGPEHIRFTLHGKQELLGLLDEEKGLILINAHAGCWQAAMSAMTFMDTSVNMLMQRNPGDVDRHVFQHSGQERPYNVIDPAGYLGGVLEMIAVLKEKQILSVMGDRVFGNPKNSMPTKFLGEDAYFPISAFTLAAATGTPCAMLLSHKSGPDSYELELAKVIRLKPGTGRKKREAIELAVGELAETLEAFCMKHPYQLFNFFDMWATPAPIEPEESSAVD